MVRELKTHKRHSTGKKKKKTNPMDDVPQNSLGLSLLFHPCPFSEVSLSNFSSRGLERGDRLARAS